jgi:dTDP-4-dehydrorhamnose 3,5-epimerase
MKIVTTDLPGVLILEPDVHRDERGFLLETYAEHRFLEAGIEARFVQDNHSRSAANVLRGLHYQLGRGQAKLISVVRGRLIDVVVEIRPGSPLFARHVQVEISASSPRLLFIPPCFAHGFYVLEDADVTYKCSDRYRPELERGIVWNDPALGIRWPTTTPLLSARDRALPRLDQLGPEDLPR